ncbi:hypothetical protein EK21DRAFT_50758, partial [Setomelanomma holmii]
MVTFHPFPRLPAELRARIWEMTIEPRIVDVQIRFKKDTTTVPHSSYGPFLSSPTPVPGPLQTCREARYGRLYHGTFSNLAIANGAPKDSERRYVWLNIDIDMISIGWTDFDRVKSVTHLIKRLRFERDNTGDVWCRTEAEDINTF